MTIDTTIPSGPVHRTDGRSPPLRLGFTDEGEPVVLFVGTATDDASIVADIGADSKWGDGSIYVSAVAGAGTIWQKRNDTWTSF